MLVGFWQFFGVQGRVLGKCGFQCGLRLGLGLGLGWVRVCVGCTLHWLCRWLVQVVSCWSLGGVRGSPGGSNW